MNMEGSVQSYLKSGTSNVKQHANLLIISCSSRKISGKAQPALQIYDGPLYRALRKRVAYMDAAQVQIFIVSAKYGFISAGTVIESYEQEITTERAIQLNMDVLDSLQRVLNNGNYTNIFVNLGSAYSPVIRGIEGILPPSVTIEYASGGIGERTSQTIKWFERAASRDNEGQIEDKNNLSG